MFKKETVKKMSMLQNLVCVANLKVTTNMTDEKLKLNKTLRC